MATRKTNKPATVQPIPEHAQPSPEQTPQSLSITLDELIGSESVRAIRLTGSIVFHSIGDIFHPEQSPALFLHLGDVNYYDDPDTDNEGQDYVPYKRYPGKMIAIPGDRPDDSNEYGSSNIDSLDAFIRGYVQPWPSVQPAAGTTYSQIENPPSLCWSLDAPFVDLIGVHANVAERRGHISHLHIEKQQETWFQQTLARIQKARAAGRRKSLIVAVRHEPYSRANHLSSAELLSQLHDSFTRSEIQPDLVLAAHSHDYQRYTRYVTFEGREREIPFFFAGIRGDGLSPVKKTPAGVRVGEYSFDKSLKGYGFLRLTVSEETIVATFFGVKERGSAQQFDEVRIDLRSNKLIPEWSAAKAG